MAPYKKFAKRIFDLIVSTTLFIFTLPIISVFCMLLLVANKGQVFFTQVRPGRYGNLFKIVKLKTMTDERDIDGNLLPDDRRMTKVGAFVRKCSIDELPQLLNVIRGDMSLVGPRPLLVEYLDLYSEEQKRRHLVRPGITGWAQVNGRNAISWHSKFEYDVWYVDNLSFILDIKILLLTFRKVLVRDGISSNSSVTMEKFNGN